MRGDKVVKKINCKHGLTYKEEIEARRLKRNALGDNEEIFKERLLKVYTEYSKNMNGGLYEYLLKNDKVIYSVFERLGGIRQMYVYLNKYNLL